MINYILTSLGLHAVLLGLLLTPQVNTTPEKVNIVLLNNSTTSKPANAPILPTYPKPLKPGRGGTKSKNQRRVDLKDYASILKGIIDPVWVSKIEPYRNQFTKQYEIIVLLNVDNSGRMYNIRLGKRCGVATYDRLALDTFHEIGSVPIPPESVVKDGIEWSLVF